MVERDLYPRLQDPAKQMQMRKLLCTPKVAGGGDFVKSYSLIISPTTLVPCLFYRWFCSNLSNITSQQLTFSTPTDTLLQAGLGSEAGMSKLFL